MKILFLPLIRGVFNNDNNNNDSDNDNDDSYNDNNKINLF